MMRKLRAVALLISISLQVNAQLPFGAIAPDFTASDLDGQSWHLYELLDQGKIVVLEFSATWCPPCWAYHNSHAMHHFYEQHGPDGDDRARVLFIEGDPNTNTNCLYGSSGCNNYTPGNWVAGTPFPILDNAEIADTFQVSYYPSIYVVCPNRKVYEVGQWNATDLWEQALQCPVAFGNTNAGIFNYSTGTPFYEVCDELGLQPAFSLINLGSEALTQATIALQWNNNTVQTVEWTGNLGLYGEVPVVFDPVVVLEGGKLETRLIHINQAPLDDDETNNLQSDTFLSAGTFNSQKILLKIRTDQYGAETYWELRDAQGNVLESGGNQEVGPNGGGMFTGIDDGPGAYGNNIIIRDTLNLPSPGCYSIHFVDAYGDGICCNYGTGYYRLYNLDDPLHPLLSGGAFRAYDDRTFGADLSTAANEPAEGLFSVALYPNPAGESITLDIAVPERTLVSVALVNSLGQTVLRLPAEWAPEGEHQRVLPLGALPEGLYWLNLLAENRQITRKFIVRR